MSQPDAPHADRRFIAHDLLTLCLRLCLEDSDSHSPETHAVLDRWRKAWEAAAGGMDFDQALALVPEYAAVPQDRHLLAAAPEPVHAPGAIDQRDRFGMSAAPASGKGEKC